MIFIVPEDFEGSFVLNTLNRALAKGMSVSISGNDLYASDVKMAIKRGSLVPMDEDYDEEMANLSSEAMVVNRTDRVLVLGEVVLRPWASLLISKDAIKSAALRSAELSGFIHIVSDEVSYEIEKPKKAKKKTTKKKKKVKAKKKVVEVVEEIEEEVFDEEKDQFIPGAERQVTAKVWNFRDQEQADAQLVPKIAEIVNVMDDDHEDLDFVDEPEELEAVVVKKATAKKKATRKKATKKVVKKTTKKKAATKTNKKKVSTAKKRKVKALEPVGDRRPPKTQMDAAIELDSRGRPLVEGGSDALNHLIDTAAAPEDVSFVDGEQAQDRYDSRTDMD